MAKAHAGYFPGRSSQFQAVNAGKKVSTFTDNNGMEYDLSSGWHYQRPKGWTNKKNRSADFSVKTKVMHDITGKKRYVRVYNDNFDDTINFHATTRIQGVANNELDERIAYANAAFDEEDPEHGKIHDTNEEGGCCGHISRMRYAEAEQVLEVTFANGDTSFFFRVPSTVAGQLFHFAKTKQMGTSPRTGQKGHMLGITFWELVRVKGNRSGAKFPFEYTADSFGTRVFAKHQERQLIKGENGYITSVVDKKTLDEVYSDMESMKRPSASLNDRGLAWGKDGKMEFVDDEKIDWSREMSASYGDDFVDDILDKMEKEESQKYAPAVWDTAKYKFIKESKEKIKQVIDLLNSDDFKDIRNENYYIASSFFHDTPENFKNDDLVSWQALKMTANDSRLPANVRQAFNELLSVARFNRGSPEGMSPHSEREFNELARVMLGKGNVHSWKKENSAGQFAVGYIGRVWTIPELKAFTNSINDIKTRKRYTMYIDNKDYKAALDLLKSTGNAKTIKDTKTGEVKPVGKIKNFASPQDSIAMPGVEEE